MRFELDHWTIRLPPQRRAIISAIESTILTSGALTTSLPVLLALLVTDWGF